MKSPRLSTSIDPDKLERLKSLSDKTKISVSSLANLCIILGLSQLDQKPIEQVLLLNVQAEKGKAA